MKVSFLVTYYNQKEYVKQSMDSMLAIEKPCDWEILVGDDGSTDGTLEAVYPYIEQYPNNIKLYIMPREIGKKYDSVRRASANRLNLLANSTGNIFCTLDGDDYFCDTAFINDAVDLFGKDENLSVIAFGFRYVANGVFGKEMVLPDSLTNKYVDKKTYLEDLYLPAGGCVHKKWFGTDRIKHIKNLGYFDDNNIVINSLDGGEMYAVNRPIYAYRQTGQSLYTGMQALEQAVLNVQGMDVDMRLIDPKWKKSIIRRYAPSVGLMYIWRNKLQEVLGEEKCRRYEAGCKNLLPSYCRDLLKYQNIQPERKKEIKNILKIRWKYTLKQYIRYCLKGILR